MPLRDLFSSTTPPAGWDGLPPGDASSMQFASTPTPARDASAGRLGGQISPIKSARGRFGHFIKNECDDRDPDPCPHTYLEQPAQASLVAALQTVEHFVRRFVVLPTHAH